MAVNGKALLELRPIIDMLDHKAVAHGVSHGLGEVGYDIRVAQAIRFGSGPICGRFVQRFTLDARGSATLAEAGEGRFITASSIEKFAVPTTLYGTVRDKSTWARRGLSVFNTVIEPGWGGFLTLEMVYHGEDELIVPAGAGIAQVIFDRVEEPAQYEGKYQDQPNRPVGAIASTTFDGGEP